MDKQANPAETEARSVLLMMRRLVRTQALGVVLALGLVTLLGQVEPTPWVALGGFGGILLTLAGALVAWSGSDRSASGRLRAMVRALAVKWFLVILGFGMAAAVVPERAPWLLLGFVATLPAYRLALLRFP